MVRWKILTSGFLGFTIGAATLPILPAHSVLSSATQQAQDQVQDQAPALVAYDRIAQTAEPSESPEPSPSPSDLPEPDDIPESDVSGSPTLVDPTQESTESSVDFEQSTPESRPESDPLASQESDASDLGESPILDAQTTLPEARIAEPEISEADQRYQLLVDADQLYLGGQFAAATALYQEAKPPFRLEEEDGPLAERPQPIYDSAQLSAGGQVYWREYQAGVEQQLETRMRIPLEFLADRYPEFIPGHLKLAEFLADRGELETAVDRLKTANSQYPQEAELAKALVEYNSELEEWIEASIVARQFMLFNPNHPEADHFQHLADDNLLQFKKQMRGKLVANTIANVFMGAAGFALTGGLLGPISAIQSSALLLQGESGIGESVTKSILAQAPLVEDAAVVDYVNELGQRLAKVAGRSEFEYEFHILVEPELNAFALPGGKIFINAGAIAKTHSEAELAGLLAHEIAHAVLSHGFQLATQGNLLANVGQYVPFVGRTGASLVVMNYSRGMERQADALGTRILAASGYAADGVRNLMVTLEAEKEENDLEEPPIWLSTHPSTSERIENIERQIQAQGLNRYAFEGVIRHQNVRETMKELLAKLEEEEESIEYDESLLPDAS